MIIETKRLFLRQMTEDDLDALYAVLGDQEIMKHYPRAFTSDMVLAWIRRNIRRYRIFGYGLWAVCLKETGEMIGDCGLTMQPINDLIRPEIGYHIRADLQRKGYASEVARAVRDWAFENFPFGEIYSYMMESNVPSQRTAAAYGCTLSEEYEDAEGCHKVYRITREEWENR